MQCSSIKFDIFGEDLKEKKLVMNTMSRDVNHYPFKTVGRSLKIIQRIHKLKVTYKMSINFEICFIVTISKRNISIRYLRRNQAVKGNVQEIRILRIW